MRVQDIMTRDVVTVSPGASLKEAAELFETRHVSGLPVVEADRLVGVLSETDIVSKETSGFSNGEVAPAEAAHLRRERAAGTVGEAMTPGAVTVEPEFSVWVAADLMLVHDVNRLPVVDRTGELVGIVTREDLVRAFARSDRDIERDIREHVLPSVGLGPAALDVTVVQGIVTVTGDMDSEMACDCLHASVRLVPGVVHVAWHVVPATPVPF